MEGNSYITLPDKVIYWLIVIGFIFFLIEGGIYLVEWLA